MPPSSGGWAWIVGLAAALWTATAAADAHGAPPLPLNEHENAGGAAIHGGREEVQEASRWLANIAGEPRPAPSRRVRDIGDEHGHVDEGSLAHHHAPEAELHASEAESKEGEESKGAEAEKEGVESEGEEAGKEGEDEEVNVQTFTIAVLLFGFLVIDMLILYCVNYPDPNIRSYVYGMISTTISIFCAVLINQAVLSLFLEQLLPSPSPRGLGLKVGYELRLAVGLIFFFFMFISINVIGYNLRLRRGHGYMFAMKVVGGHITAFAGITTFGNLMKLGNLDDHLWQELGILAFAALVLFGSALASSLVRDKLAQKLLREKAEKAEKPEYVRLEWTPAAPSGQAAKLEDVNMMEAGKAEEGGTEERKSTVEEEHWVEDVAETEDDASALITSFLMQQCVVFKITGNLLAVDGDCEIDNKWQILGLVASACFFLICLVISTYVRRNSFSQRFEKKIWHMRRTGDVVQTFFAMSMSWCLLRIGSAMLLKFVKVYTMAFVANAFVMTLLALIVIRLLDFVADRLVEAKQEVRKEFTTKMEECRIELKGKEMPAELTQLDGIVAANPDWDPDVVDGQTFARRSSTADFRAWDVSKFDIAGTKALMTGHFAEAEKLGKQIVANLEDNENTEQAIRKVIEALGLLVGLCWDKAFDASDETLVEGNSYLKQHPVLAKVGLAFALVIFVMPAWLWYIVPKAKMDWTDHQHVIDAQSKSNGHEQRRRFGRRSSRSYVDISSLTPGSGG